MSVIRNNSFQDKQIKRSSYQLAIFAAIVLGVVCIILSIILFGGSTSDNSLRNTLLDRVLIEEEAARTAASQLSRTGGSTTMVLIGRTRQHLYALSQLNDLTSTLLNEASPVPADAINVALEALDGCIARLLEGQAIDAQLATLWAQITVIQASVDALRI